MPNLSAHSYNQTAKTVSKPKAPKLVSTSGVFRRAPLVSSQAIVTLSTAQQQPASVVPAGIVPNKVTKSGRPVKRDPISQAVCGSFGINKAPFCTSKMPLASNLNKQAGSQTSQRKIETQKKPQEALKAVRRINPVSSELAQRSYTVKSKALKAPGQTLTSKESTNSKAVCIKSLHHKTENRMTRTTVLSQAPSNVSQTLRLRPLDHGSTQVKDKSRPSTLRLGISKDNHKPTAMSRKPPNSVLSKPAGTVATRASKAPTLSVIPQTKANATMAPADTRQKVTTAAKMPKFDQPPPKSIKPHCRPVTAPAAITKAVRRTGPLLVPEYLKTPATQGRPLTARPRTELKSTQRKPTAAQEERQ